MFSLIDIRINNRTIRKNYHHHHYYYFFPSPQNISPDCYLERINQSPFVEVWEIPEFNQVFINIIYLFKTKVVRTLISDLPSRDLLFLQTFSNKKKTLTIIIIIFSQWFFLRNDKSKDVRHGEITNKQTKRKKKKNKKYFFSF